ncbi:hypothetical protein [Leptolyngbya sp. NIES-2104]|uniref:hypothetical protein n=1 Tax=Leptolyngbya sp. NIES-2104 TaxID=1552121 RepID=UPI0006EC7487|nr:hypothetical protein [Leptolyngbya sp. NIES-2104]GAP96201.1 hypothetical protein NIES2104_27360 [Leptolyngbya sp. NIES-2104]
MTLQEQVQQQRVRHIISSYQLDGEDHELCAACLTAMLQLYPTGLIELALVETIVQNWARVPMIKGVEFFRQVEALLTQWQTDAKASLHGYVFAVSFSPDEFYLVTGLDASPIFGSPNSTSTIAQR